MASNQQTIVTKEVWVEKKKKELTEEEASSGEKKYKIETVVCGQIKNIEVLLSANDLKRLYNEEIEAVIKGLEKLDLQTASPSQIKNIGRSVSSLDVRLEKAAKLKDLAIGFLTYDNLYPMLEKMHPMDTISRKDLELYETFIKSL
ncbi:TPA: hypothetical protein ACJ12I_001142 [Klebsiella pneumoniae]|nr:hypothetical protein [Klebsiella pneumoniae]HBY4209099.1 hypothetical protein [Klebsiella pneumoniae]